jgi:NAD(P)-dependent dehydrogenase (short-subunit alcohol dehydrogenase family)
VTGPGAASPPPSAGPVALVTGAAGGLGRAIAGRLEATGWTVAAATHRDGPLAFDLAARGAADALVAEVLARHGRLDLLVANHATMAMGPVDALPLETWWRIVDTNLSASFRLARATAGALVEAGGSIVFVASEWGITGWPRASAYAASKAGLIGLTKALALELAPSVRVNALAPGVVDTPQLLVDAADAGLPLDEMRRRYAADAPLGRIAAPDEIAGSVAFLVSGDAAYYTGQVLSPNGGTTRP